MIYQPAPNRPASTGEPMTPRVSVIVPTRNSARTITECLKSVRTAPGANIEVLVVDNSSTDDTARIASQFADRVIVAGPERSAQRNIGARCSRGDIVVFLDSDMIAEPELLDEIVRAFDDDELLSGLVLPEFSFGTGFFAACRSLEKRLYLGDRHAEAARAFRRSAFDRVGGFDESLTAAEDYNLADRVAGVGSIGRVHAAVWHDEGCVRLTEVFKKKRYYGQWLWSWSQSDLARTRMNRSSLWRRPLTLLHDPVHSLGLFVLKAVDASGLVLGATQARRQIRRP